MLKEDLKVDLSEEYKISIVKAVQEGLKQYSANYKKEFNTITNNGQHSVIWDFINTEVIKEMPSSKFEVIVAKRGLWELILIFDKETNHLYSLMKEKRLRQLQHRIRKDTIHYIDALVKNNADLNELASEQTNMFEYIDEDRNEHIDKTLCEMLHAIKEKVERYILVTFSDSNYEVLSISADIVAENLDIVYSESWEQYIQAEFDMVISSLKDSYDNDDEVTEDIPLSLKVVANEEIILEKDIEKQEKDEIDSFS